MALGENGVINQAQIAADLHARAELQERLDSIRLAGEMEAFALYLIGKMENIDTACMLTVVDSKYEPDTIISSEERETSLNEMIKIALEALIK